MTGSAKDEIDWYARGLEDGAKGERCHKVPAKYHFAYRDGFEEGEVQRILKRPDGFTEAVEHICRRHGDGEIEADRAMSLIGIAVVEREPESVIITMKLLEELLEKKRHYEILELAATSGNVLDDLRMLKKLVTNCKVKDVVANLAEELHRRRNPGWLQQAGGEMASSGGRGSKSPDPKGS